MNGLAYLIALAILVINDHVLKALAPGIVTGKLSDFAGLFAFAVFLCAVLPRRIAIVAAGAFFVYWKSPWSQPLIDALPWDAARVVDWTDLAALIVLPFAARVRIERPRTAIATLSLVAFAATSSVGQHIWPEKTIVELEMPFAAAMQHLEQCGLKPHEFEGHDGQLMWVTYRSKLARRGVRASARVEEKDGRTVLDFFSVDVGGRQPLPDERAYLEELERRIRECM